MNIAPRSRTLFSRIRPPRVLLSVIVFVIIACSADAVLGADSRSQSISARVGQQVEVTLGNVGPAIYESPPMISSNVVTYLGVDVVPPYNPGGPTQRFSFKAVGAGQAVVTFRRTLDGALVSVVEDTVKVR
jgi:hypothetical protein